MGTDATAGCHTPVTACDDAARMASRPTQRLLAALALTTLLAGCAGGAGDAAGTSAVAPSATPAATPVSGAPATPGVSADPSASPSAEPTAAGSSATPVAFDQVWATTPLTDVATGETFTIAGLAGEGRAVIVETMAIWCSNCFRQQGRVYEALGSLDPARVAYVLIDVDPNETADALAEYRASNGFTGRYAVASSELARSLAADFGDQVLNPPAVPMVLVAPDGRVTLAEYGGHGPDEVVELARAHGA
jgi:thiol-disulfide isomerase/thioredoxin